MKQIAKKIFVTSTSAAALFIGAQATASANLAQAPSQTSSSNVNYQNPSGSQVTAQTATVTEQVSTQATPAVATTNATAPQVAAVSSAPATSMDTASLLAYAQNFIGTPYQWGGSTPAGFDCSGFTQYVFSHFGKNIGRTTYQQQYAGTRISVDQAQPGDLLFWGDSPYHVAIYLGNGQYISAPTYGQTVSIQSMAYYYPSFAVRVN